MNSVMMKFAVAAIISSVLSLGPVAGFSVVGPTITSTPSISSAQRAVGGQEDEPRNEYDRRTLVSTTVAMASLLLSPLSCSSPARADEDSFDVDSFLRSGQVANPMGVSSQAGKSRPETGVLLREGTEVARAKNGGVVAEILVGAAASPTAILASFESPWPLAKGFVFDVECRDAKSGDGAFLAVSRAVPKNVGGSVRDLPTQFLLDELFKPTGRFSFYGVPTDVKVKKQYLDATEKYKILELTFSNLSQSTNAEIPRNAIVSVTIPDGSANAVMLTGSATANRWKKGSGDDVRQAVASFRAVPAPKTNLKVRAKRPRGSLDELELS